MSGDHFIFSVLQWTDNQWCQHALRLDTLCELLHILVVLHLKGMGREWMQLDSRFRKYWHSDFVMKLGKKADGYDVQQFVVLENIDDMLRYELVQTLVMGIGFKRCENCGMLFVPSGRSDTL